MQNIRRECPCCGKVSSFPVIVTEEKDVNCLSIINSEEPLTNCIAICHHCGFVVMFDDELRKDNDAIRDFIYSDEYQKYMNSDISFDKKPWYLLSQIAANVYHDYRLAGFAMLKLYNLTEFDNDNNSKRYLDSIIGYFWKSFEASKQFIDLLMLTDCIRRSKHWQAAFQDANGMKKCFEGRAVDEWYQKEKEWIKIKDNERKIINFDPRSIITKRNR